MTNNATRGLSWGKLAVVSVATALLTLVALWLSGSTSGAKAQQLIQSASPSIRFFASSIMTAAATTLALMVTVLGLTRTLDAQFQKAHYVRLRQLGLVAVITVLGSLLLLSFVTLPLEDSGRLELHWFDAIYFGLIGYVSLLTGAVTAMVWMLYELLSDLISVATGSPSDLLAGDEDSNRE